MQDSRDTNIPQGKLMAIDGSAWSLKDVKLRKMILKQSVKHLFDMRKLIDLIWIFIINKLYRDE